jgi:hypothetical protein
MASSKQDNVAGKTTVRNVSDADIERNCGIHDFTTKDPKKWAEHIGNTPGHVDFGAAPCIVCGREVNYKSRGFNPKGERDGVMCQTCEEKAVRGGDRLGRSESGNVGVEFVNEVSQGKRKIGEDQQPTQPTTPPQQQQGQQGGQAQPR